MWIKIFNVARTSSDKSSRTTDSRQFGEATNIQEARFVPCPPGPSQAMAQSHTVNQKTNNIAKF